MPLENNPSTISDLDATWPIGQDVTTMTDDNFRNLKRVLKLIFPGVAENGFDKPIITTEDELNYLSGATSNVQDQLDLLSAGGVASPWFLSAPENTQIPWLTAVAPPGWTISPYTPAGSQSYSLVVGPPEIAGETAGRDSPLSWTHGHAVQGFSLSADQIPPHTHRLVSRIGGDRPSWDDGNVQVYFVDSPVTGTDLNAGETRTSGGGAAITQAITATAEFQPLVVHSTLIIRDPEPEEDEDA